MDNGQNEMTFLEHLEALRWHIMRSLAVIMVLAVVFFIFKDFVFDYLILAPSKPEFPSNRMFWFLADKLNMPVLQINKTTLKLQNIAMVGQFTTHVTVSFIMGCIVGFPYLFWEFWRFVKPGLYPNEIKSAKGAIWAVSLLFIVGILFAYYLIVPLSIDFLGTYKVSDQVENVVNLNSYISTVTSILLAGGAVFELPVFIYFLSKVGLVSSSFLITYRRHSIVIIVIFAAIITPPDVVSQIMVAIPLLLLYEVSIKMAKNIEREKQSHTKKNQNE